jgi:di/tricarboxylate transporter
LGYPLLTRIRLTIGGLILGLTLIAGLFVGHRLSPVGFAVSVLVLAVIAGIVLTRFLQRFRNLHKEIDPLQPLDERKLRRQVRTSKIILTAFILLLLAALWEAKTRPLSGNLIAMAAGCFWVFASILGLRHQQAKLKQFEDRRTI